MLDEQQERTTTDSEGASPALLGDSLVEKLADVQVIRRITSFHSTPLPDAETLGAYARLIPNGADRVMTLVEREVAHRHRQESSDTQHVARGHWMGFIVTLPLASGGVCLGLLDHDWLAAAHCTTTIGAVVTTFVVEGKSRRAGPTDGEL
jgi:uncharacterized membrane protein